MTASIEMRAARAVKTAKATTLIDKSMKVLEIGPSYAPIAAKSDGWNVYSLDHASQDELRLKYQGAPHIAIEDIEPVDFIWCAGPPSSAIPPKQHGTFDACIASHVLEHIPDPITWLSDIGRLLRPKGVLSLVLPDKRYELDYFRPLSTAGTWLDAKGRAKHTQGTLFDAGAYCVTNDGQPFWGQGTVGEIKFYSELATALDYSAKAFSSEYVDAHAWCFTPSSFKLIMLDLNVNNIVPFVLASDIQFTDFEFFSSWKVSPKVNRSELDLAEQRMDLLKEIQRELKAQHDYLFPSENQTRGDEGLVDDLQDVRRNIDRWSTFSNWLVRASHRLR
jgi:SAM-dependent methyltransferase